MCETLIFKYNRIKYNFFDKIQEIFKLKISLEAIHTLSSTNTNEQVLFSNDTTTELQKHFYNSDLYNDFCILYYDFVKNEIGKLFPNEEYLVVQKDPGFRVSLPNNTALGKKNEDYNDIIGLHCDGDYNHPPEEYNYIIAVTELFDTNSVYIESEIDKADYKPIRLFWNEFLQFYGNKLHHHNKINLTGQSRVSFDIRVIPYSKYNPLYDKVSVHQNRKFLIDSYFIKIKL